jgi:hypothetical protein
MKSQIVGTVATYLIDRVLLADVLPAANLHPVEEQELPGQQTT